MSGRSAPGNSTPTWRRTSTLYGLLLVPLAAAYVIVAFTAPSPMLRIALRCAPVLPVAIWTLWFDRSRPFQTQALILRTTARAILLLLVMAFALLVLGAALNWLYDPNRVV